MVVQTGKEQYSGSKTLTLIHLQTEDRNKSARGNVHLSYPLNIFQCILQDEHLFSLEKFVKRKIVERNLCLATLMGEAQKMAAAAAQIHNEPTAAHLAHSDDEDSPSKAKAFTAGVNHKKLRCLKL